MGLLVERVADYAERIFDKHTHDPDDQSGRNHGNAQKSVIQQFRDLRFKNRLPPAEIGQNEIPEPHKGSAPEHPAQNGDLQISCGGADIPEQCGKNRGQ